MKTIYNLKILLAVLLLAQSAFYVCAQKSKEEKYYTHDSAHWVAEIPLWIPGLRGQISYGDFDFSSEGNEGGLFKGLQNEAVLEFYFVGRIAAQFNKIWFQADAFSGKIGNTFSCVSKTENTEKALVDITVQGAFPRLVMGYSVWNRSTGNDFKIELLPYLGLRYISCYLHSEVYASANQIDARTEWFEPLIGIFVPIKYKRSKFEVQADYGTIGSKNSWALNTAYHYRISKLIDLQLGWNHLRLHIKDTVDNQELKATVKFSGPSAGIGFRF